MDKVSSGNNIFVVQIGESGKVVDVSAVAASAFNVDIIESLKATDTVLARLRWEPIDDDQTAAWNGINNTQSAGWAAINDDQPSAWAPVNDDQVPTWTEVDDDQGPNWTPITTV